MRRCEERVFYFFASLQKFFVIVDTGIIASAGSIGLVA
jgi:hypothetical protein